MVTVIIAIFFLIFNVFTVSITYTDPAIASLGLSLNDSNDIHQSQPQPLNNIRLTSKSSQILRSSSFLTTISPAVSSNKNIQQPSSQPNHTTKSTFHNETAIIDNNKTNLNKFSRSSSSIDKKNVLEPINIRNIQLSKLNLNSTTLSQSISDLSNNNDKNIDVCTASTSSVFNINSGNDDDEKNNLTVDNNHTTNYSTSSITMKDNDMNKNITNTSITSKPKDDETKTIQLPQVTLPNLSYDKNDIGQYFQMYSFRFDKWHDIEILDYETVKDLHKCKFPDFTVQWLNLKKKPIRMLETFKAI